MSFNCRLLVTLSLPSSLVVAQQGYIRGELERREQFLVSLSPSPVAEASDPPAQWWSPSPITTGSFSPYPSNPSPIVPVSLHPSSPSLVPSMITVEPSHVPSSAPTETCEDIPPEANVMADAADPCKDNNAPDVAKGIGGYVGKTNITNADCFWIDSDGVDPMTAGCHYNYRKRNACSCDITTQTKAFFGEYCKDGLLVESNPGKGECHPHVDGKGKPDLFNCTLYCRDEKKRTKGKCEVIPNFCPPPQKFPTLPHKPSAKCECTGKCLVTMQNNSEAKISCGVTVCCVYEGGAKSGVMTATDCSQQLGTVKMYEDKSFCD